MEKLHIEDLGSNPAFDFIASPAPKVGDVIRVGQFGGSEVKIRVVKVTPQASGSVMISGTVVEEETDG